MKKDKLKIIDYAKDLYLQYDERGDKRYSLRDIEKEILQKFDKKLTAQTVKNWSDKYGWNAILDKAKQFGIEKSTKENFTKEEQIIDAIANEVTKNFERAKALSDIGYDIISDAYKENKEHPLISIRDAMTAIKMGTDIQFRLMEIPDNAININDNSVKIYLPKKDD